MVDHCSESPCQNNGTCLNLANNHTCDCVMGFTGKYCEGLYGTLIDQLNEKSEALLYGHYDHQARIIIFLLFYLSI